MITFNQYIININNQKSEETKKEVSPCFESDNWLVYKCESYVQFCDHFELDEINYNIRCDKGKIFILKNKSDQNKNCWLTFINQQKMFLRDGLNGRIELGGFKISNPELQPFFEGIENYKDKP